MKKIESKLFDKFELENDKLKSIIGGAYTSASSDTSMSGGRYDVCQETCINGESMTDTTVTSFAGDNADKPLTFEVAP